MTTISTDRPVSQSCVALVLAAAISLLTATAGFAADTGGVPKSPPSDGADFSFPPSDLGLDRTYPLIGPGPWNPDRPAFRADSVPQESAPHADGAPGSTQASSSCFPDAQHPLSPLEGYKDTYILPYAYDTIGSPDRMHEEVKFQVSIRKELFRCTPVHVYFGYTQLSLWEFYQPANSRAFRTSDYNPELFTVIDTGGHSVFPDKIQSGIEHQSNGAGGVNERSWNRIYEQSFWKAADDALTVALKLWWRIPEGPPASPSNPGGDDNPDIEDYLGIFELRGWWRFGAFHSFSAMYRRGYRDGTDTGEVDYDVTIGTPASGVMARLQVFSGYGETLVDYKRRVDRVGIGFIFH